jgi:flagellar biosynthesis protein FlhG
MADQADRLRDLLSHKNAPIFNINQNIIIEVFQGYYAGRFSSRIRSVNKDHIGISMPVRDGKITPIAISTQVRIQCLDGSSVNAVVVERQNYPVPNLVLKTVSSTRQKAKSRVFTITSGKGGVGKTNIAVNLAISMRSMGYKTLLFDADIGLANADLIMGVTPNYCLRDFLEGKRCINEVIEEGPAGVLLIAGGSGIVELADLDESKLLKIENELSKLEELADVLIIDTGAGITTRVINFISAADEVVIVTTPEPTAVTDAYTIIKVCSSKVKTGKTYHLIVNRAENSQEACDIAEKLKVACNKFLNFQLEYAGYLGENGLFSKSVKQQIPFIIKYPNTITSKQVEIIAKSLLGADMKFDNYDSSGGFRGFFSRLFNR